MGFFNRKSNGATVPWAKKHSPESSNGTPEGVTPAPSIHNVSANNDDAYKQLPVTWLALILGAVASIGGFMFGYESGQISGTRFQYRFSHGILIFSRFSCRV